MMRQAGRALPEYRELRQKFPDFLSFVRNAEAAADATLMPTNRFDIDAAILFSDILVALPYMGFDLKFVPGKGPVISNPFRSEADLQNLHPVNLDKDLEYTKLALQKVRKELSKEKPIPSELKDCIGIAYGASFYSFHLDQYDRMYKKQFKEDAKLSDAKRNPAKLYDEFHSPSNVFRYVFQ